MTLVHSYTALVVTSKSNVIITLTDTGPFIIQRINSTVTCQRSCLQICSANSESLLSDKVKKNFHVKRGYVCRYTNDDGYSYSNQATGGASMFKRLVSEGTLQKHFLSSDITRYRCDARRPLGTLNPGNVVALPVLWFH